jgi:serine/threonine-protein kinase
VVTASLPAEDLEGAPTVRMARTAPLPEGTRSDFGTYRLSGLLGVGGMARTYLGVRRRDGLPVAIKVPHEHLLTDGDSSERFLREGRLGATLHHPNIVRIYEAADLGGRPFIAMELLEGETLEAALHREGALAVERALGVARGIAQALDYAHLKGVVHRDLKPDNVMLLSSGEVKVMDYGIARVLGSPGVTATGTYLGTPVYSSPESLRAKEVDHRSDLYSLGIILYHMVAGKVPFSSTDPLELLTMHVREPLPPLPDGLPPPVGEIVGRLTAKSPGDRYPSAEMLLRDLDRLLNSL